MSIAAADSWLMERADGSVAATAHRLGWGGLPAPPGMPADTTLLPLLAIGGSALLLLIGLVLLSRYLLSRTMRAAQETPLPPETPTFSSAEQVARLRREAQITYVELGRRTGIPARVIAEVELGLKQLAPEHAMRIVACLRPPQEQKPPG